MTCSLLLLRQILSNGAQAMCRSLFIADTTFNDDDDDSMKMGVFAPACERERERDSKLKNICAILAQTKPFINGSHV